MRITRQNYEAYFIDYVDGQLTKELEVELMRFLEAHPDLREELEAFDRSIKLDPDTSISYPQKSNLKKEVHQKQPSKGNIEDWFIAYYEADLDSNQIGLLFKFLDENPGLKQEFELFGKLKLKADKDVVYKDKKNLKKNPSGRKAVLLRYTSYAAAAAILLLAGIFWLVENEKPSSGPIDLDPVARYDIRQIDHDKKPVEDLTFRAKADDVEITAPLSINELENPNLASLSPITSLDEELSLNSRQNITRRYEQTSEYYYQSVQLDLEYYNKVKKYARKNFVEQLAYRMKNKIFHPEDYYVTDPGFSPLNIFGIGTGRFEELADAETSQVASPSKKTKKYSIKTPLFEFSHKRTPVQSPSGAASE